MIGGRAKFAFALVALGTAGAIVLEAAAPVPVTAYPDGSVLMDMIHVEDAGVAVSEAGLLEASQAVDKAAAAAGDLADREKPYTVQLAYITDDAYGPTDEEGNLLAKTIDHRLCWLVRFTGTPQPIYGGVRPDGKAQADGEPTAEELNVVIDAKSGEVLLMFSFQ